MFIQFNAGSPRQFSVYTGGLQTDRKYNQIKFLNLAASGFIDIRDLVGFTSWYRGRTGDFGLNETNSEFILGAIVISLKIFAISTNLEVLY